MAYFEEIEIGATMEVGSHTFTEPEIIAFAEEYDPQYFHVDPVKAKDGLFGGLVASGFHVGSIWMKLTIAYRDRAAKNQSSDDQQPSGVSPGFLDMRWPIPVRPGDTITFTNTIAEKIDLKSRPNLGIMRSRNVGINQHGEAVFSFTGQALIARRTPFTPNQD